MNALIPPPTILRRREDKKPSIREAVPVLTGEFGSDAINAVASSLNIFSPDFDTTRKLIQNMRLTLTEEQKAKTAPQIKKLIDEMGKVFEIKTGRTSNLESADAFRQNIETLDKTTAELEGYFDKVNSAIGGSTTNINSLIREFENDPNKKLFSMVLAVHINFGAFIGHDYFDENGMPLNPNEFLKALKRELGGEGAKAYSAAGVATWTGIVEEYKNYKKDALTLKDSEDLDRLKNMNFFTAYSFGKAYQAYSDTGSVDVESDRLILETVL
ncbi:hypothetical protein HZC08_02090, partial [Candidatus Micrarchaeota archaeon]|nr:hypothetical protein [Candidatus Micrarchaeota archaeon]